MVDGTLPCDSSRMLVFSVDMPISGQVTEASPGEPFLCLKVELDPARIADLMLKVYPDGRPQAQKSLAIYAAPSEPAIINAATRLVELMAQAEEVELIAPLVVDEILVRLLLSPIGARVAQIGQEDSRLQRVAKAVTWERTHYDRPLGLAGRRRQQERPARATPWPSLAGGSLRQDRHE
jgi:hypothetical protein